MTLKKLAIAFPFALSSIMASAELIQVEFTDTFGKNKHFESIQNAYLNSTTPPSFVLSGGLDRKLRVRIIDAADNTIEDVTSGAITISDRMTVSDKDFYGKRINLASALSDSNYRAVIDMLDVQGNVVESNEYSFTIDTTPPAFGSEMKFTRHAWGNGNISSFDYLNEREIYITDISDNGSGLDSAFFIATLDGTTDERSTPVSLDADAGRASWLKPSSSEYRALFYQNRSDYTIGFKVYDKAGNEGRITRTSGFNGICGSTTISHIWNPITSHWDDYQSGMTVFENPYTFRVEVPAGEHINTNGTGRFGYNWGISSQEGDYIYRNQPGVYPPSSRSLTYYTDTGYCKSISQSHLSVKLAPDVEEGPKYGGMSYHIEGESSWRNSTTLRTNIPFVVDGMELKAQARSYEQKATLSGHGSCIIPANETSCKIDINYSRTTGNGYAPYQFWLASTDGRFNNHVTHFYSYWDVEAPQFENISYDDEQVSFDIYDASAVNDWRRGWWLPSTIELRAVNNSTSEVYKPALIESNEPNYQRWSRKYSLSELPEGNYYLEGYVKDTYGNENTVRIKSSFWRDSTPPLVSFIVDNSALGDTLEGLENLRIHLKDRNTAAITSVQLIGGPSTDDVYLAWTQVDTNEYQLEYPRIFPSLDVGEGYELKVSVADSAGNAATYIANFSYSPANMVEVSKAKTLPVAMALKTKDNQPVGIVRSSVLRTDSGSIAAGEQLLIFTLRSDSDFSVNFAGENFTAGETKEVTVDLGQTGELSEEITPLEAMTGTADFMLEIPQLTSKYD